MFVGKVRSLTKSGAPERYLANVGSGLTCKGRLAKDKHSSLLQKFVNYGQKRFIALAHGLRINLCFELTLGEQEDVIME